MGVNIKELKLHPFIIGGGLLLIVVLGFLLRAALAYKSIPYFFYWDEPQTVSSALHMIKQGSLNPEFYNYGSLSIYVQYLADHIYFLFNDTANQIKTYHDTDWHWSISHPDVLFLNRIVQALWGSGLIIFSYLLTTYVLESKVLGLLSSFVVAVTGFLIFNSSIVTTDVPVALLVLIAVYCATRYRFEFEPKYLYLSLVFCGFAAATKYNSAVVLVVPYMAMRELKLLGNVAVPGKKVLFIIPAIAFLIAMPYAILDMRLFIIYLFNEFSHYAVNGHPGEESARGFDQLFFQLTEMNDNLGSIVFAVAMVAIYACRKDNEKMQFVFIFPFVFTLFMSLMKTNFHRNFVQVYPFMALFFAAGVNFLLQKIKTSISKPFKRIAVLTVCSFLLSFSLINQAIDQVDASIKSYQERFDSRTVLIQHLASSPEYRTVVIAEELRIHPVDLEMIEGRYEVQPLRVILNNYLSGEDMVYLVPRNIGLFNSYKSELITDELRSLVSDWNAFIKVLPQENILTSFGQGGRALKLNIYSVSPEVLLIH